MFEDAGEHVFQRGSDAVLAVCIHPAGAVVKRGIEEFRPGWGDIVGSEIGNHFVLEVFIA
jgi:hypothetical protein